MMPGSDSVDGPALALAADPEPPPRLTVEVVEEAGDWGRLGVFEDIVAGVVEAAGAQPSPGRYMPAEACIALLDDAELPRPHGQFRAQEKPTHVLSIPEPAGSLAGERRPLGDIALGYETLLREASELGKPATEHACHLVLHGLLHLMGHDHETDAEAEVMEALESEILIGLGHADPYAEAADGPAKS